MSETWISVGSHRARGAVKRLGVGGASYGVWPLDKDGRISGWPRGEYYKVGPELAEKCRSVKGVRVMANPPRGEIFRRWGA